MRPVNASLARALRINPDLDQSGSGRTNGKSISELSPLVVVTPPSPRAVSLAMEDDQTWLMASTEKSSDSNSFTCSAVTEDVSRTKSHLPPLTQSLLRPPTNRAVRASSLGEPKAVKLSPFVTVMNEHEEEIHILGTSQKGALDTSMTEETQSSRRQFLTRSKSFKSKHTPIQTSLDEGSSSFTQHLQLLNDKEKELRCQSPVLTTETESRSETSAPETLAKPLGEWNIEMTPSVNEFEPVSDSTRPKKPEKTEKQKKKSKKKNKNTKKDKSVKPKRTLPSNDNEHDFSPLLDDESHAYDDCIPKGYMPLPELESSASSESLVSALTNPTLDGLDYVSTPQSETEILTQLDQVELQQHMLEIHRSKLLSKLGRTHDSLGFSEHVHRSPTDDLEPSSRSRLSTRSDPIGSSFETKKRSSKSKSKRRSSDSSRSRSQTRSRSKSKSRRGRSRSLSPDLFGYEQLA